MMRCFSALLLTGSLLSMPLAASADDAAQASRDAAATGALRVTVVDQTGAAVAAAQVILVSADGMARTAATNERGEGVLDGVVPATYTLRVEFPGFDTYEEPSFVVKRGQTKRDVILKVGGYAEELEVTIDNTDKQLAQAYSNTLTGEQIDALPDDEEEMAEVLEQMAGPGAILRVNGFSGGRLPPKSQIQEIRFRFDPYSAENHEAGFPRVDIMTRPGSTTWRNSASLTFRGDELNARNAFAPEQSDEQAGRYQWSIDGPLVKGKSSFALSVGGLDAYETETLLSSTSAGTTRGVVSQPTTRLNVNLRLEHALSKAHVLRAEYQRNAVTQRNLGVGQFEQLDRAYDRETTGNVLRLSETGTFGGKLRNELRVQFGWDDAESASLSDATTIRVQDAFTTGGAQVLGGRRSRTLEIADNVDLPIGKRQTLRAGVLFEGGWYRGDELRNATGTFTFSSLDAYLAGQPIQFTRREGDPLVEYSQWQGAIYVQDDIRLRKNLMVSAGLRYEAQSHASDFDNLAPRLFVTWSPGKSGQTTIRAGAGIFHEWFDSSLYEQTLRLDGTRQRDIVILNPGYPDPLSGGTLVVLPGSVMSVAERLSLPTVQRASFGLEHRFTGWLQMRANVFTQRGSQELRSLNINAPIDGVRPEADYGTNLAHRRDRPLGEDRRRPGPEHDGAGEAHLRGPLLHLRADEERRGQRDEPAGQRHRPRGGVGLRARRHAAPPVREHERAARLRLPGEHEPALPVGAAVPRSRPASTTTEIRCSTTGLRASAATAPAATGSSPWTCD